MHNHKKSTSLSENLQSGIKSLFGKTKNENTQKQEEEKKPSYQQFEKPLDRSRYQSQPRQSFNYKAMENQSRSIQQNINNQKKRTLKEYQDEQDHLGTLLTPMPRPQYKPDFCDPQQEQSKPSTHELLEEIEAKEYDHPLLVQSDEQSQMQSIESIQSFSTDYLLKGMTKKPENYEDRFKQTKFDHLENEILKEQNQERFEQNLIDEEKKESNLIMAYQQLDHYMRDIRNEGQEGAQKQQNHFEYQAHLIVQTRKLQIPSQIQFDQNHLIQGAMLESIDGACIFQDKELFIWSTKNPKDFAKIEFKQQILGVNCVSSGLAALPYNYLLITTPDQIYKYSVFCRENQTIELKEMEGDQSISSDNDNLTRVFQSSTGRLFVGGQGAYLSEISLNNTSLLRRLFSEGPKMKKIEQSQSIFQKLMPSFLFGSKRQNQVVVDIAEHKLTNSLFVCVQDYSEMNKSYIDVYDLGRTGQDFKKIMKITMNELIDSLQNVISLTKEQRKNVQFQNICTLESQKSDLQIIFSNGSQVFLKFQVGNLSKEEFMKTKWGSVDKQQSYQPTYISVKEEEPQWQVSNIVGSTFEMAISISNQIWDTDFILEKKFSWKPLLTSPYYFNLTSMIFQQNDFEIIKWHTSKVDQIEVTALRNAQDEQFLIVTCPNFRVQRNEKDNSKLITVIKLEDSEIYDISTSTIKDKLTVQVLTNQGIIRYIMPSPFDHMATYLSLLTQAQVKDLVDIDFNMYISTQDAIETLVLLTQIACSSIKHDKYVFSTYIISHYQTMQQLRIQNYPNKEIIKIMTQTLQNYIGREDFQEGKITNEMKQLAFQLMLKLTESDANEVQMKVIMNTSTNSYNYPEQKRIVALYEYLARQYLSVSSIKLFRAISQDGKTMINNITPAHLQKYLFKIENILEFINANQVKLAANEGFGEMETNEISLKDQLNAIQLLLTQKIGGLRLISSLIQYQGLRTAIYEELDSTQQQELASFSLNSYLQNGSETSSILRLIEAFISQVDVMLMAKSPMLKELQQICKVFIHENIVPVIIARKQLRVASKIKDKSNQAYLKQSALAYLFSVSPIHINLNIAVFELLSNDLVNQTIRLAISKAKHLQKQQRFIIKQEQHRETGDNNQILKEYEDQIQNCYSVILELLQETVDRIKEKKITDTSISIKKQTEKPSSFFKGIMIFRERIKSIKDDTTLLRIQADILKCAIAHDIEPLHYLLYDYLISEGLLGDLMRLQTPFVTNYINEMTVINKDDQGKELVQLQKIEVVYKHMIYLKQYRQCFQFLMERVLNSETIIDVDHRLKWLLQAETAMEQGNLQATSVKTPEYLKLEQDLFYYKEYLTIIREVREKFRKSLPKIKDEDERQQAKQIHAKLSYEIITEDEMKTVALQNKMWVLLVRIFEVCDFKLVEQKQGREILFENMWKLYESLIYDRYKANQDARDFIKFIRKLDKIHLSLKSNEIKLQIMFPSNLLITAFEETNVQWMIERQEGKYLQQEVDISLGWHPFWHVEFFLNREIKSFIQVFQTLREFTQDLQQQRQKLLDPEYYFAQAYMITQWKQYAQEYEIKTLIVHMDQIVNKIKSAFQDELLYNKDYICQMKSFMDRVSKSLDELKRQ